LRYCNYHLVSWCITYTQVDLLVLKQAYLLIIAFNSEESKILKIHWCNLTHAWSEHMFFNITVQKFGVGNILLIQIQISDALHLFDQKYSTNHDIVKYY